MFSHFIFSDILCFALSCLLDSNTSRLTDVLKQFRDGVYPKYNPEQVGYYTRTDGKSQKPFMQIKYVFIETRMVLQIYIYIFHFLGFRLKSI
jgi:hypothetical protein